MRMNAPDLTFLVLMVEWERTSKDRREKFTAALRAMPYELFLETPFWQAVAAEIRRLRGNRCENCKTCFGKLAVHHQTYAHHGAEHLHLEDLVLLCERCHMAQHIEETLDRLSGRSLEFEQEETRKRVASALATQRWRYGT